MLPVCGLNGDCNARRTCLSIKPGPFLVHVPDEKVFLQSLILSCWKVVLPRVQVFGIITLPTKKFLKEKSEIKRYPAFFFATTMIFFSSGIFLFAIGACLLISLDITPEVQSFYQKPCSVRWDSFLLP
jgi:hypothetical protein